MSNIERSNTPARFTPEQLAANVRESRAFWSSPAGKQRQAQLDRENRSRKPSANLPASASYWQRRLALLEKHAPKI